MGFVHPEPTPILGGWRVAETDTHYIDVMQMLFNFRITSTPRDSPFTYDGGWCYVGRGRQTLLRAHAAACAWALEGGPEPKGWNKNVMTGEWRDNPDEDRPE